MKKVIGRSPRRSTPCDVKAQLCKGQASTQNNQRHQTRKPKATRAATSSIWTIRCTTLFHRGWVFRFTSARKIVGCQAQLLGGEGVKKIRLCVSCPSLTHPYPFPPPLSSTGATSVDERCAWRMVGRQEDVPCICKLGRATCGLWEWCICFTFKVSGENLAFCLENHVNLWEDLFALSSNIRDGNIPFYYFKDILVTNPERLNSSFKDKAAINVYTGWTN